MSFGYSVFALDCRGQGGFSEDRGGVTGTTLKGHIIRGLADAPQQLLFRQIFLDTAQLTGIAMQMPEVDPKRVGATGGSQGGGLTLACAALEPRIKRAAPIFPFLCDYQRVWEMDLATGAYEELKTYFRHFDPHHEREQEIFTKLGYIDCQYLAPRIRGEVLMFTGLMDQICPPSTQFAAYNKITAKKNMVMPVLITFLAERGLSLSQEKTKITHITEGFNFLGWNVRKYNGKLLIKPSKANTKAHLSKVREIIKTNKAIKQVDLIGILNPVLRGWANYHRHSVAKDVFAHNDSEIWSMLWKWAKRRHPKKNFQWVMDKYFHTRKNRKWMFIANNAGNSGEHRLFIEASIPIRRHVKIRTKANPYDPAWAEYFTARKKQMRKSTPLSCRVPEGALFEA